MEDMSTCILSHVLIIQLQGRFNNLYWDSVQFITIFVNTDRIKFLNVKLDVKSLLLCVKTVYYTVLWIVSV